MGGKTHKTSRRKALKAMSAGVGTTAFLTGEVWAQSEGEGEVPDFVTNARYEIENTRSELAFLTSVKQHYQQSMSEIINGYKNNTVSSTSDVSTMDTADPRASVYLGTDTTLNPDHGDKYESDDAGSLQDAELKARYDTGNNTVEAYAWDNAGYGTFTAWAYIAREFIIEDSSGSQNATITVRPTVIADMGFAGECGNSATLEFWVEDHTDNELYDETIFSFTDYTREWSKDCVDSIQVPLEAGHGYTAGCRIRAETTCEANAGSGVSDFSLHDEDEIVDVGQFEVNF
jgi:hypothetical protein